MHSCLVIFMLGFGGGLVSGDTVEVACLLGEKSELCLKTLGSTKIYKSIGEKVVHQIIRFSLASGSILALLPDPMTCYANSNFRQSQHLNLEKNASVVVCDWYSSGRKHMGESWLADRLQSEISITIDGKLMLYDNLDIMTTKYSSAADKVGNYHVIGCVIIVGPRTTDLRKRLLTVLSGRQSFEDKESCGHLPSRKKVKREESAEPSHEHVNESLISVSAIDSDITLVRFATNRVEDAYHFLASVLQPLNDEIPGIHPYKDRIHTSAASNSSNTPIQCNQILAAIEALRMHDLKEC